MGTKEDINIQIITWAIARAGYDLHEFSLKFPRVLDWIEGTKKPTIKQLEEFTEKVHIPFGYMFLETPPKEVLPIPYFRSDKNESDKVSINVYDTIQLMLQRQDWLKDYLVENGFDKLGFVGKYKGSTNIKSIVQDIRSKLNLPEDWANSFRSWEEALNHMVETIEESRIIVTFNGVVENNTHRPINVEECRGFVLVDEYAPFMFVNNTDSKSAQMFTIVHELAHIWTGHSAGFDFRKLQPADDPIEKTCDLIAAEFLVPQELFYKVWDSYPSIRGASKNFKVSEMVIARRALDLGKLNKKEFFAFYDGYKNREFKKKERKSSGGDFYATARKRLSITFASHVEQAVKSGQLLFRDAYKLTSMKGDTFNEFFTRYT